MTNRAKLLENLRALGGRGLGWIEYGPAFVEKLLPFLTDGRQIRGQFFQPTGKVRRLCGREPIFDIPVLQQASRGLSIRDLLEEGFAAFGVTGQRESDLSLQIVRRSPQSLDQNGPGRG